jgi:hypothetical protein
MSSTAIADDWWARDFACSSAELRPTQTRVQPHAGALLGNPGIWILVAGGAPLISLPPDTIDVLRDRAQAWSAADVADAATLQQQLSRFCPRAVERVVGPAFIGYGSADSLDLQEARLARPISSLAAVRQLQASCQPEECLRDHGVSEQAWPL